MSSHSASLYRANHNNMTDGSDDQLVVQWLGRSLITRPARVQFLGWEARIVWCKNLALYIRDCESLCLSDEILKAVGPFYLVFMPGEVKDPTQGVNV